MVLEEFYALNDSYELFDSGQFDSETLNCIPVNYNCDKYEKVKIKYWQITRCRYNTEFSEFNFISCRILYSIVPQRSGGLEESKYFEQNEFLAR